MSKVRFNLHSTSGGTIIRLVFRFSGYKFVYYPGFSVNRSDWNAKSMEVRKGAPMWQEVNAGLRRLKNEAERIYLESLGADPLTPNALKAKLDIFWKGKSAPKSSTVVEFIRSVANDRENSGAIRHATAKALRTLASQIERFRRSVRFGDINLEFHRDFTAFLVGENKSPNTVNSSIKRLKNVMSHAVDRGLTENQAFRSKRFTAKQVEADNIYLNEANIAALEAVTDFKSRHQEAVRDSFLLGVYTGLRYSDYSDVRPEDIKTVDGVTMVTRRMVKTSRVVAAPINSKALTILNKYDMRPPSIPNQVLNRYIKEVAKLAGLTEMVKIERVRGAERQTLMLPKWKLVSTHTARRTFATLEYLKAMSEGRDFEPIMDILGIKSRVVFLKYIKVSEVEKVVRWVKAGR